MLEVDGELGDKKVYDPRAYLAKSIESMKQRVVQAAHDLRSEGQSLGG